MTLQHQKILCLLKKENTQNSTLADSSVPSGKGKVSSGTQRLVFAWTLASSKLSLFSRQ